MALHIINHPLIEHKITIMRKKDTSTILFRQLVAEVGMLMAYEITKDLEQEEIHIDTPVQETSAKIIAGKKMVIVPILRAGLGMVEGFQTVIPNAKIGHVGFERDETTLMPREYLVKLPSSIDQRDVILVDPMLATGGTAIAAIDSLKRNGATKIKMVCLVGCPYGVDMLTKAHPDVDIYLGAMDMQLSENGYIVPGLGDAGDRIFGTD